MPRILTDSIRDARLVDIAREEAFSEETMAVAV
jgi:hypothetical protein